MPLIADRIAATSDVGLYVFTKAVAETGMEKGIGVNAVNPNMIETDRLADALKARQFPEEESRARLLKLSVRRGSENLWVESVHGALVDVDGRRTREH